MTPDELLRYLDFAIRAHSDRAKAPRNIVRLADGETPYAIHPLWCALTILTEHALPRDLRVRGAKALVLHDVLEDTDAPLPDWVEDDVRFAVDAMTFRCFPQERRLLLARCAPEIVLLKLYDKVSNLLDGDWMSDGKKRDYKAFTLLLTEETEKRYGQLNITRMARAVIGDTKKEGGQ